MTHFLKTYVPIILIVMGAAICFKAAYEQPIQAVGGEASSHQTAEEEEEKAKQTHGEYVQVLKDGTIPDGKQFDRSKLPPNSYVNVYDGPKGKGWQIVTEYDDRIEYKGYGPQARDYTSTYWKSIVTASST